MGVISALAVLIVAIYRFRSTFVWHLSRLIALLRVNLFIYRELWNWLTIPSIHPHSVRLNNWNSRLRQHQAGGTIIQTSILDGISPTRDC